MEIRFSQNGNKIPFSDEHNVCTLLVQTLIGIEKFGFEFSKKK